VHLQKLHESHRDRGLVVIGYNCWDDHDIARDLLAKHSITFPTVLDTSMPAMMTAMQKYKMNGVPLTYVIDREGRIAEAFYGYTEGDTRGFETVEKLGIEID
jgi:peroxiredoxin